MTKKKEFRILRVSGLSMNVIGELRYFQLNTPDQDIIHKLSRHGLKEPINITFEIGNLKYKGEVAPVLIASGLQNRIEFAEPAYNYYQSQSSGSGEAGPW